MQSKAGKSLGRYFPDVIAAVESLNAKQFVLDGEIVIPVQARLSFDELRHGTRFIRWRPDKAPEQCTLAQIGRDCTHSEACAPVPGWSREEMRMPEKTTLKRAREASPSHHARNVARTKRS